MRKNLSSICKQDPEHNIKWLIPDSGVVAFHEIWF
jgi:hypothetical protein